MSSLLSLPSCLTLPKQDQQDQLQLSVLTSDMGKAEGAADRIFKIIETESKINAVDIDKDMTKKNIINTETVEGKIEFKDVWFRYPTRKEDFVLRGLTITVNPNEQVRSP